MEESRKEKNREARFLYPWSHHRESSNLLVAIRREDRVSFRQYLDIPIQRGAFLRDAYGNTAAAVASERSWDKVRV